MLTAIRKWLAGLGAAMALDGGTCSRVGHRRAYHWNPDLREPVTFTY